ncbi:nucleotide-binding universal stress UspA family protein [Saccharopolyspora erythraea NRRL 2338]|uniref:Universal stress protein family n=2 Tax=Saccharopolyspora erythraea TaxID=1836 RepID=A4FCI8_SACEN|nr:universal stress protein [Saccharopolyspora erythraea]EQD87427.1 universal stress protein [Saccharopolyspora erythraea D]PFG95527.1 nucleotide-binding universal stress UspA family protein [Saccharopolyspora erythraea NRRL 2338]QRK92151.1 universal stress protein [Saccharopolyspora erythraea]CAM01763.1 universal stress protein family [Saccharopolyspora erythraea NRRL 2338]
MTDRPVIAGVDGSDDALKAVRWATSEAARRHARLTLLLVNDDPARAEYAQQAVQKAARACTAQEPGIEVVSEVAEGHPVEELLRRSEHAQMLVLGARGHGGFTDALLGGVSTAVATHAACPVVVVRRSIPTSVGPVVVGVDGSASSTRALEFAFESAARTSAELVVLQAWHEEGLLTELIPAPDPEQVQREVERSVTEQTAQLREQHPQVRTREVVLHEHPVAALTNAARDARLLVVGHRGRGGFETLFLGSVASGVLHHAPCPVAVVRMP